MTYEELRKAADRLWKLYHGAPIEFTNIHIVCSIAALADETQDLKERITNIDRILEDHRDAKMIAEYNFDKDLAEENKRLKEEVEDLKRHNTNLRITNAEGQKYIEAVFDTIRAMRGDK